MDASVRCYGAEGSAESLTDRLNGRQRVREVPEHRWVPSRPQRTALSPQADLHPRRRRFFSASYRGDLRTVPIENVIYLQAGHKYVTVRHTGGELLLDESLQSLEDEFSDVFLRVHRNALVAKCRLSGLSKGSSHRVKACLHDCPDQLPVSRRHLARIRRLLLDGFDGALNGPDFPLGHSMLAHLTVALPIEIRDQLKGASEQTGEDVARIVGRALRKELELLQREGRRGPGSPWPG